MYFRKIRFFIVTANLLPVNVLTLKGKQNIDPFDVLPLFVLTSLDVILGTNLLFDLFSGPSGFSAGRSPQG